MTLTLTRPILQTPMLLQARAASGSSHAMISPSASLPAHAHTLALSVDPAIASSFLHVRHFKFRWQVFVLLAAASSAVKTRSGGEFGSATPDAVAALLEPAFVAAAGSAPRPPAATPFHRAHPIWG